MVKQVEPTATLNLPWGLEAAISDLHRREVAKEHRTSLLLALETHEQGRRK
jgi:DNA transformation protein